MKSKEVVFHVTYKCPLTCSHCCFSSDMTKSGHLSIETVTNVIEQAARVKGLEKIEFVGGDPFLHPDLIEYASGFATSLGLTTAAVTSAFWAGSYQRAFEVLKPIAAAGLREITLSYDDMHAEFVKPKTIINAFLAARELGVRTKIAVVVGPGSTIDKDKILELLDADTSDDNLLIYETFINSTGRALDNVTDADVAERRADDRVYRGACHSVLRTFSVTPEQKIMPCCGVLPYHERLAVGDTKTERMEDVIERAYDDPVMKWLAFEGPVEILKQITADSDAPLTDADFDGICNACDVLLSNDTYFSLLQKALPKKQGALEVLEMVYHAAGKFERPQVDRLSPNWAKAVCKSKSG